MTRHPVRRVAVIGAGISGVVSAAHLVSEGLEVTVFERNRAAGGVWLYDERRPPEPEYPAVKPSRGECTVSESGEVDAFLEHAPPGPCYDGLKNNVSTQLIRTKLNAWPTETPEFVNHRVLKEYIQETSEMAGVEDATIYGAKVKGVSKYGQVWNVTWTTLRVDWNGVVTERERSESFDAVVVATGHYHAPRVPDIPGLADTKRKWPTRILHSKAYRRPDEFKDKNVLLIGGGVSSIDVAREIGPIAKKVYQSTRNGEFDVPSSLLPDNGMRISEVLQFAVQPNNSSEDGKLPLVVHLKSGQELCGIDAIILCTGYHISLPFLRNYHDDGKRPEEADETILVTDGTQVHNLHKDIFYIPDPTLAFVGIPYYTATFTLFEFQAIAVAAVFSGTASLPSRTDMRREYLGKLKRLGSGRKFHSLKDVEEDYVIDLLVWINEHRAERGLSPIEGHTKAWRNTKDAHRQRLAAIYGCGPKIAGVDMKLPQFATCT